MNAEDVIEQMSSGNVHRPALYKVTIKEGAQVTEIAETIATEQSGIKMMLRVN